VDPNELPAGSAATPDSEAQPNPFPPAFRWETSPPEAPTQVMGPVAPGAAGPAYQEDADEARDLFQPPDQSVPPWAAAPEPPPAAAATPAAAKPTSRHILGIAVLAVVVAGLVGAVVGYVATAGHPEGTGLGPPPTVAASNLPAPPPPLPEPVDTDHALIDPPGKPRAGGGPFDLASLRNAHLLPQPILAALQAGGMSDGALKTTTRDGTTIGMFALTMPDPPAATAVAQTIITVQREGGLSVDRTRALQGVAVLSSAPTSETTVYRAVYVLYHRVIYFEVFGTDRDAVLTTFDELMKAQVTHAPPTVRTG
jgi:hypothetical protein